MGASHFELPWMPLPGRAPGPEAVGAAFWGWIRGWLKTVRTSDQAFAQSLEPGRRMRLSIVESTSKETNVVEVVVRRLEGKILGMQFVDKISD